MHYISKKIYIVISKSNNQSKSGGNSNTAKFKMKTLKSLKEESRKFYTENAADYFSKSFSKKMGGTQKITFEDNFIQPIEIDKREYYTGRGAKYNSNSMHEHIDVFVTKSEFEEKVNSRATMFFERQKEDKNKANELIKVCSSYGLNSKLFSSVSENFLFFEKSKKSEIENELNIDLSDFFAASGKTYFFADSNIGLLMFYHNNHQSYGFEKVSEEKRQEFLNERENWVNAPYAYEVGNKVENLNLYVC